MPRGARQRDQDGGWAWVVLCSCAMCVMLTSGLAILAGMFQKVFLEELQSGVVITSWITSLYYSLQQLTGPASGVVCSVYGCRVSVMLGAILMTLGFFLSSFCRGVFSLLFTFGLISGLGVGFIYTAAIVRVNFSFIRYRPLASGIVLAAGGVGIMFIPPSFQLLLHSYSCWELLVILSVVSAQMVLLGGLMFPNDETGGDFCRDGILCCGKPAKEDLSVTQKAGISYSSGKLKSPGKEEKEEEKEEKKKKEEEKKKKEEEKKKKKKEEEKKKKVKENGPREVPTISISGEDGAALSILIQGDGNSADISALCEEFTRQLKATDRPGKDNDVVVIVTEHAPESGERPQGVGDSKDNCLEHPSTVLNGKMQNGFSKLKNGLDEPVIPGGRRGKKAVESKDFDGRDPKVNGDSVHALLIPNTEQQQQHQQNHVHNSGDDRRLNHIKERIFSSLSNISFKTDPDNVSHFLGSMQSIHGLMGPKQAPEPEHSSPSADQTTWQKMVSVVKNPSMSIFCVQLFLYSAAVGSVLVHFGEFCLQHGSDFETLSTSYSMFGLALTLARLLLGLLTQDRNIDTLSVFVGMSLVSTFVLFVTPYVAFTAPLQISVLAALGFYSGGSFALLSEITIQITGVNTLGLAYGLEMVAAGLAFLVAPPMSGALVVWTGSYTSVFTLAGAMKLASAIIAMTMSLTRPVWKPSEPSDTESNIAPPADDKDLDI